MDQHHWREVDHEGPIVPDERGPQFEDHEVQELYSRNAFENENGIRVVKKRRVSEKPNGGPWYENWVDVVDEQTEEILYSSSFGDEWALEKDIEKLMGLIDGVS